MILLSASKVWLWVQRDGGIWSFLTWTKSHLSLHRHPEVSLEVVEETLLILQENQDYSLLELVDAVPRWMFSAPDLLQGFWFVRLRLEKWIFNFLWEISPLFHWVFFELISDSSTRFQLLNVCNQYVHPRTECIQGTIQVRLSFQIDGFLAGLSQK